MGIEHGGIGNTGCAWLIITLVIIFFFGFGFAGFGFAG
jgi:hypothetical protein